MEQVSITLSEGTWKAINSQAVQPAVQFGDKFCWAQRKKRQSLRSADLGNFSAMLKFQRPAENWEEIFGEKMFNFKNNMHT